jgi:putative inorganic carbon (HCO3(-)) transporter
MGAALAVATAVKGLGAVVAVGAAGGALLLPGGRMRALSALLALALTPVLLLGELWGSPQLVTLRHHGALLGVGALLGLGAVVALAAVLRRWPWLLPPLAVFTLPFRVPLESGGESANLLIPLYLVVAAGVLAYAWNRLVATREGRAATAGNGSAHVGPWRDPAPGRLEIALVVLAVLYALQSLYSSDFETALKNIAFFYVPFILLLRLLTSVTWTRRVVTACFGVLVVLAMLFAGVGFAEYATRHLFWNQKVIASNQFETYFRVNSLFFDPNIYGRFLAMTMIGLAATLLWPRRAREVALASVILAVLWAGLILTFSQSSIAALLVGLAVLAAVRWGIRPVAIAFGAVVVVGLVVVLAAPRLVHVNIRSSKSIDRATSGRLDLMRGGLSMFADRPLQGFGSGAFAERFRQRESASSRDAASASHTIPITFGAEQGVIGLAAYIAVLVTAFSLLFRGLGRLRERAPPLRLVTRAYIAAAFTGLVLHTFLYAAFLEDPITWTLLAAGIVLARAGAETASGASSSPSASSASGSGRTGSST